MDDKKNQAVHDFVDREFQAIPRSMIEVYLQANEEGIEDITRLEIGSTYTLANTQEEVEVLSFDESSNLYTVMTDDGEEREIEAYEVQENDYHGLDLPMWSTMWLLERNYWKNHVKELSEAGFKVYDLKDENNLLVGIDAAGYNFMEAHFEPLYDSLGYKWHLADENTVSVQKAVALAVELGGKLDQIAKKLDLPKDTVMKYVPQKTR